MGKVPKLRNARKVATFPTEAQKKFTPNKASPGRPKKRPKKKATPRKDNYR
jgi:hypothetical protein